MRAGTRVEVETTCGSYRGQLTRAHDGRGDVELRCAGHYLRLHRSCIRQVRSLDNPMLQR